jgi:hypothetical protein
MPAVYLIELLIHMGWYEKWQLSRVCHKEAQRHKKYLRTGLTDNQLKPILSWEKPHDIHSDTGRTRRHWLHGVSYERNSCLLPTSKLIWRFE